MGRFVGTKHPPSKKKSRLKKKNVKQIPFAKDTFLCFLMVFLGGIGGKPVVLVKAYIPMDRGINRIQEIPTQDLGFPEDKRHPVAQFLLGKQKKRKHLWSMICEGTTTR